MIDDMSNEYQNFAYALQEYLYRHRTQCIDVDSAGRKCKERMMTVLAEMECQPIEDKFVVLEIDTVEQLKKFFVEIGLQDLYESYVRQLNK